MIILTSCDNKCSKWHNPKSTVFLMCYFACFFFFWETVTSHVSCYDFTSKDHVFKSQPTRSNELEVFSRYLSSALLYRYSYSDFLSSCKGTNILNSHFHEYCLVYRLIWKSKSSRLPSKPVFVVYCTKPRDLYHYYS